MPKQVPSVSPPMTVGLEVSEGSSGVPLPLALLEKAIKVQTPLTERHIARLRRNRPDATPAEIVGRLNAELRAATISAGAGVGAAAAAPGVGTAASIALAGGEAVAFLNATVLYILARSEVQGIEIEEIERRRTLVMAVMLGDAGAKGVGAVAERTGQHWARHIVQTIPMARIDAINKVLGRYFITKYGTKKGIIVLGRVVPFGIGAVIGGAANGVFSQGVITAASRAFGPPPRSWDDPTAQADSPSVRSFRTGWRSRSIRSTNGKAVIGPTSNPEIAS